MNDALLVQRKGEIVEEIISVFTTTEVTALLVGTLVSTIAVVVPATLWINRMITSRGGRNEDDTKRWKIEAYRKQYAGSTTILPRK